MTTMTAIPAGPSRPRLLDRVNPRLVTIAVVFGIIVGIPAFTLIKHSLSGGIEKSGDGYAVDLKTLGHFPFNETTDTIAAVPPRFVELNGKKVALEGFVVPIDGGRNFQFVYNVQKCCFGGPPQVQERVFGHLDKGAQSTIPGIDQEVRCIGTLHVKVDRDPETHKCGSIYTMDVQRLEPL
jgi:hypothetical protein